MKPITQFFADQVRDTDLALLRAQENKTHLSEVEPYGSDILDDAMQILVYRTVVRGIAITYYETRLHLEEGIDTTDWSVDRIITHAYETARSS